MNSAIVPKKTYLLVWAALLILLVLTWGLAQLDLGPFNTIAALAIAFAKMLLVILIFMHVRSSPRVTWIFVAAGFIWLFIMIDLSLSDYLTRRALPSTLQTSWEHGTWPAPVKEGPGVPQPVSATNPKEHSN